MTALKVPETSTDPSSSSNQWSSQLLKQKDVVDLDGDRANTPFPLRPRIPASQFPSFGRSMFSRRDQRTMMDGSSSDDDIGTRGFPKFPTRYNPSSFDPHYKLKMDIPYFNGQLSIEDFLDWIASVELYFDTANVPEEMRVKLVAYRFKGGAIAWWEQLNAQRFRMGKSEINSWFKMRKKLRAGVLPRDYSKILWQQYHCCSQGTKTVEDYTSEFCRLSARNDLNESEELLVTRYVTGLTPYIQDKVELSPIETLDDDIDLAT